MQRIRVFGNIEVFLNYTPGVGQERSVCANSAAKLISLNNTVGGDCHQFAVRNLECHPRASCVKCHLVTQLQE